MTYCKVGEKPKIKYKFKNRELRTYEAAKAPVSVEVVSIPNNSNGLTDKSLYKVTFLYASNWDTDVCGIQPRYPREINIWGRIGRIVTIDPICGSGIRSTNPSVYLECRGRGTSPGEFKTHQIFVGGHGGGDGFYQIERMSISKIELNSSYQDTEDNKFDCQIQVKYNNQTIFTDTGRCPCDFEVICGDCPEGFLKCEKPEYPGYCCIPCNEIKAELVASRVALRMLKNG